MITLDEIKKAIESGECKRIYISSGSAWWTHLDSDLENSTELGKKVSQNNHERLMRNTEIPITERNKIDQLYKTSAKNGGVPLDPGGSPLFVIDKVEYFISQAESKADHYGKYGLAAFMKAHHQNCEGIAFNNWGEVTEFLDQKK